MEAAPIFLTVAGAIIMVLLSAIAYFMKKWIESTDALTCSVNELKTAFALMQSNVSNADRSCSLKHTVVDKRLDEHSRKINWHEKEITRLGSIVTSK